MSSSTEPAQRAYDVLAPVYDEQIAGGVWMRQILWDRYVALFQPGDHILDLGCGTGIDLVHLAQRGVRVTGFDLSRGMLARAQERIDRAGVGELVRTEVRDLNDLGHLNGVEYDGAIASFAAINTVNSPASLSAVLAAGMRPGARVMVHALNRRSAREWAGLVVRGHLKGARALSQQSERVFLLNGVPVPHALWNGRELFDHGFAANFELERAYALGLSRFTDNRAGDGVLANVLGWLDARLGTYAPFVDWGQWIVLEMKRRPTY